MNMSQSSTQMSAIERHNRNGFAITVSFIVTAIAAIVLFGYFAYSENIPQLYIPVALLVATVFINLYPLSLIRKGRTNLAMLIVGAVYLFDVVAIEFIVQGLGIIISITTVMLLLFIAGLAVSSNYSVLGTAVALLAGVATFALDIFLSGNRIQVPLLAAYAPYVALGLIVPVFIVFVREFNNFNLQIKITLGILITGGITVATIAYFGLSRAGEIVNSISEKFETSVTEETKANILNRVRTEASNTDLLFSDITNSLKEIAEYRARLDEQKSLIANGVYWDSFGRVFQLPQGQYGNASTDIASIYIPNTIPITEEMLADINASVYLDFLAPNFLKTHPETVAIYYISASGYTVYYPNTSLAQNVPPDYDPRTDSFYTIATPERNPDRLPRWTDPYQDPAGAGLIITLSIPVYTESGEFKGVMGADLKLASISELVANIQLSDTDFAFVIDKNGFIIYMPEEGYQAFGMQPKEVTGSVLTKQSVFDTEIPNLEFAAQRIVFNQANLVEVPINGINTYVVSSTLPATEYKLVIFAPTDELNTKILASRQEVQNDIQNSLANASLILIGLFIGALIISLIVGQIITRPVKRLTNTVEQIAGGDLTARANIETEDEAGALARSFNQMAERLNNTLQGLEEKVTERTNEIEIISKSNAKRAAQFESIARISRVMSSTQTLDRLLPQIVQNISDEFDFYHVGIFLLDVHKEFAVLAAANSDGGKRMLERNHRLKVGETGIVGFVTRAGQPRIALDVGADAVFFNNPDLPETRSEIALPLRIEADIFGALDVQSTETNAFSEEDVNILSVLADQVSIAIQNARSYQQSREALEQAEISAAQMIEQQWNQFLSRQNITQYHFDGVEARQFSTTDKQAHNLAIPLILRGAQIGTLRLSTTDANRVWDEDEIAIAQATAERTALAIENARLLQEAQKRAAKEKTIGDISAKISNLISLENILETTIQELGSTLPGTEVAIQFTNETPEHE
ncbi:MAG: GAF domain-containing protein [Anaerolineales bacterium]|nr:GAF domain-containing protein [Anaerolineales bacterium]